MADENSGYFTMAGVVIGALASIGGVVLQHHLSKGESRKNRLRERGHKIENLINDYERAACKYWSLPEHESDLAQDILDLRKKIGFEFSSLAKSKVDCSRPKKLLTELHKAATLDDSFNTINKIVSNVAVIIIQDKANSLRYSIRKSFDVD